MLTIRKLAEQPLPKAFCRLVLESEKTMRALAISGDAETMKQLVSSGCVDFQAALRRAAHKHYIHYVDVMQLTVRATQSPNFDDT